jgi:predicted nucleic acid-binding protein
VFDDRVTRGMPMSIVDCLEVVYVQEEDSETTMSAFDSFDRMLTPILEKGSVAEAGE